MATNDLRTHTRGAVDISGRAAYYPCIALMLLNLYGASSPELPCPDIVDVVLRSSAKSQMRVLPLIPKFVVSMSV